MISSENNEIESFIFEIDNFVTKQIYQHDVWNFS